MDWEFRIVTINKQAGIVRSQFVFNVNGRREIGSTTAHSCSPELLERATKFFHNPLVGVPAENDSVHSVSD